MIPFRTHIHIDPETDTPIEETWYKLRDGGYYREFSRPSGLPETTLWKHFTEGLK